MVAKQRRQMGIRYQISGVIEKESSLLVATEQTFRTQFAIDCRTRCEVVGISSKKKTVELKNHATGEVTTEKYDKLVLSPGATSGQVGSCGTVYGSSPGYFWPEMEHPINGGPCPPEAHQGQPDRIKE